MALKYRIQVLTIDPTLEVQYITAFTGWEQVNGGSTRYHQESDTIKAFVVYGWDEANGETGPLGSEYQMKVTLADSDSDNNLDDDYSMRLLGVVQLPDFSFRGVILSYA